MPRVSQQGDSTKVIVGALMCIMAEHLRVGPTVHTSWNSPGDSGHHSGWNVYSTATKPKSLLFLPFVQYLSSLQADRVKMSVVGQIYLRLTLWVNILGTDLIQ